MDRQEPKYWPGKPSSNGDGGNGEHNGYMLQPQFGFTSGWHIPGLRILELKENLPGALFPFPGFLPTYITRAALWTEGSWPTPSTMLI